MNRVAPVLWLHVLAGCFEPNVAECSFVCEVGERCPLGLTCGDDGFCHESVADAVCGPPATDAAADAGLSIAIIGETDRVETGGDFDFLHDTDSGDNRYLIVGLGLPTRTVTISRMVYEGLDMARLGRREPAVGGPVVELWGLAEPTIGSGTISVRFTVNEPMPVVVGALSLAGVDGAMPIRDDDGATGTGQAAGSELITRTGDRLVGVVATASPDSEGAILFRPPLEQVWQHAIADASTGITSAVGTGPAGAFDTLYGADLATDVAWAIELVSLTPAQ